MKLIVALACLITMPAVAAAPGDVDITGTWALTGDIAGNQIAETCTLTQKDTALSGSCTTDTGKYDTKGKVDGKTITLKHGGSYQGTDLNMTYTGKLGTDGAMTGTLDVEPFNVTGSFTAKKNPDATAK